jgi:hypothetical protein
MDLRVKYTNCYTEEIQNFLYSFLADKNSTRDKVTEIDYYLAEAIGGTDTILKYRLTKNPNETKELKSLESGELVGIGRDGGQLIFYDNNKGLSTQLSTQLISPHFLPNHATNAANFFSERNNLTIEKSRERVIVQHAGFNIIFHTDTFPNDSFLEENLGTCFEIEVKFSDINQKQNAENLLKNITDKTNSIGTKTKENYYNLYKQILYTKYPYLNQNYLLSLTPNDLLSFSNIVHDSEKINYNERTQIITQGDLVKTSFYILLSGSASVYQGRELIKTIIPETSAIIGDLALYNDCRIPRTADVIIESNSLVLKVPASEIIDHISSLQAKTEKAQLVQGGLALRSLEYLGRVA